MPTSPPERTVIGSAHPSMWTWKNVSEPRCSATPTRPFHVPSLSDGVMCSGRMPIVCASCFAASGPSRKFILGEPMNPATNLFRGER